MFQDEGRDVDVRSAGFELEAPPPPELLGKIVECACSKTKKLRVLKPRLDKSTPNDALIVHATYNNICEDVTREELAAALV